MLGEAMKYAELTLVALALTVMAVVCFREQDGFKDVSIDRPATAQVVTLPKTEPDSMLNLPAGEWAKEHEK